ncbi:MAG: BlaI/MecI/CopY family transcriptional regulator [Candidatus Elarobacter sp.]
MQFRPKGKGVNQVLGELQTRVMEQLWSDGPTALATIHRALARRGEVAYTTVATELTRLQRKGLVRKTGTYLETRYAAAISREAFVERFVGDVLAGLVGAHGRAAIHGFVDAIAGDDEALDETLRLLQERRRAR